MRQSLTRRRVLQQLLELRGRQLRASDGHEHAELRELRLDVVLLQERGERGGGDALGGAVRGALHQVNDDLRPGERQRHETVTEARAEMCLCRCVCQRASLVVGQGFNAVDVDSEGLVAPEDLVERLHQLLLLRSHVSFLFVDDQDHQTVFILAHWDAAVAHRLGRGEEEGIPIRLALTATQTTRHPQLCRATWSHLEPAEWVLLGEVDRRVVVGVVALAGSPVGLQLVPFGQDRVTLISEQGGCRQSGDLLVQLGGLRLTLLQRLLAE